MSAADCLEANSMQQIIPIIKGEGDVNSSEIEVDHKDPDEASKISEAEKLIEKLDQQIIRINEKCDILRPKWRDGWSQLRKIKYFPSTFSDGMEWQKMMLDYLQVALEKLNFAKISHKGVANKSSFSTERNIRGFKCRMLHGNGSRNMATEWQLLGEIGRSKERLSDLIDPRPLLQQYGLLWQIFWYDFGGIDKARYTQMVEQIKQIEKRKEKALADAIEKGEPWNWNPLTAKRAILEQIKLVKKISVELRREQGEVMAEIKRLEKDFKAIDKEATVLIEQRRELRRRKAEAQENIRKIEAIA